MKEIWQYLIDVDDREHMIIETEHLKTNDDIDFYIGFVIILIFGYYIRQKAQQYLMRRQKILAANRLTSRWADLKERDVDNRVTEETCNICLVDFQDQDRVIQLPCNVNHVFHKSCFDRTLEG